MSYPGSTRLGEGTSRSQIRATLDENADVVGSQDYYPFGEVIQGRSFVSGGLNKNINLPAVALLH